MSKIWGVPSPKSGVARPPIFDVFRRLRNLTATSTANIFGMKHDIDNRTTIGSGNYKSPLHRAKSHELWSTNGFYPPFVNSAFYFTAGFASGGQHTELN